MWATDDTPASRRDRSARPSGSLAGAASIALRDDQLAPRLPRFARPAVARGRAGHRGRRDGRLHGARLVARRCDVHDRHHADDRRLQGGPRARRARPSVDGPRGGRRCRHHLRIGRDRRRGGPVRGGQRTTGGETDGRGDRRTCAGTSSCAATDGSARRSRASSPTSASGSSSSTSTPHRSRRRRPTATSS